jgi:hypothetical protein
MLAYSDGRVMSLNKSVTTKILGRFLSDMIFALIFLLLFSVNTASAREAQRIQTPKSSASVSPISHHMPGDVRFLIGGEESTVVLETIAPAEDRAIGESDSTIAKKAGHTSISTGLVFVDGRSLQVVSVFRHDEPSLILHSPTGETSGALVLAVRGADRVVMRNGEQFIVLTPDRLKGEGLEVVGDLVVQDAKTQHGLTLTAGPGEATWRVRAVDGKLVINAVYSDKDRFIRLAAFRGDSLLALESAENTPTSYPFSSDTVMVADPSTDAPVGRWEFWPDRGRVFDLIKADPREAYFRFGLMSREGEIFEDVNLGGDMGLLYHRISDDERLSLTARGLFTARFDVHSESFDLQNNDFIGGLALGYQRGPDSFELYLYHQSSHLGDEVTERGDRHRIDYARETVRLLWSRTWDNFRFYAGPSFNIHALPSDIEHRFTIQSGAEFDFPVLGRPMFIAADFQSRQEHDWSINSSLQIGMDLGNPVVTSNRQWLFAEFFSGHSNMGQFWDVWETYQLIGVGYQFR